MSSNDASLDILEAENYLLGTLTDDQALDFECEVFSDENLSEQLEFLRNRLSEKYIRNELNTKQKAQFENHFLSFPYNAEIFTFQKSLLGQFEKRETPAEIETEIVPVTIQTEEKTGVFAWFTNLFTAKMVLVPAFAALVLAVFGGILLYDFRNGAEFVRTVPTPTPIRETTPTPMEENTNISTTQNQNQTNDNRPTKENNQNNPSETPTPTLKDNIPKMKSPIIATVALIGSFRDVGSKEKPVIIGKETEKLSLEFQYPEENSDEPVANYKLILEGISGNKIWEQNLPKDGKKSGDRLKENIASKNLETGQYRFRVIGVSQDNKEETVQSQTFFIKRIS